MRRALLVAAALGAATPSPATAAAPTYVVSSFTATGYDGVSPADVSIAVSPADVVETINTGFRVYSHSGTLLGSREFSSLFAPATNVFCIDPTVVWSATAGRFAIACADALTNTTNRLALSRTASPLGGWNTWSTGPNTWEDQPSVEIAKRTLVLTGTTSGQSRVYVYQLSDLEAGDTSPRMASFLLTVGVQRAVHELDGRASAYLVQAYPGSPVYLTTITGTPATGVNHAIQDLGPDPLTPPIEPSIPGGHYGGSDLDGRVTTTMFAHTSAGTNVIQFSQMALCGSRDCDGNGRITLTSTGPVLTYVHKFASATFDLTYGAVVLDGAGQPFEAESASTSSTTPEAAIHTAGFFRVVAASKPSATACKASQPPPCDERWGDYLGAAPDPTNPNRVWLAGLAQTATGGDGWRTVISRVTVS
jgi:hypothetical protein